MSLLQHFLKKLTGNFLILFYIFRFCFSLIPDFDLVLPRICTENLQNALAHPSLCPGPDFPCVTLVPRLALLFPVSLYIFLIFFVCPAWGMLLSCARSASP